MGGSRRTWRPNRLFLKPTHHGFAQRFGADSFSFTFVPARSSSVPRVATTSFSARSPKTSTRLGSYLWRQRRGELVNVSEPKTSLDRGNLLYRVFKTVLTKLFVLNVFESVIHLVELFAIHRPLPGGNDDCVFASGMVSIHQHERLKSLCQRLGIVCP